VEFAKPGQDGLKVRGCRLTMLVVAALPLQCSEIIIEFSNQVWQGVLPDTLIQSLDVALSPIKEFLVRRCAAVT